MAEISKKSQQYWRINLRLTAGLLSLWLGLTFVASYFADELNQFSVFGFPFGFYMAAQGSLVVYLGIVWFYARYMNRLDKTYEVNDDD